jgi:hypothetical protein
VILETFFAGWFVCFSGDFCKKWVVKRGFLMVNLWWMCVDLWFFDGHFLAPKNFPLSPNLFLAIPIWECGSVVCGMRKRRTFAAGSAGHGARRDDWFGSHFITTLGATTCFSMHLEIIRSAE